MPEGRTRSRTKSLNIDRDEIFDRVEKFFNIDGQSRDADRTDRLERYAKFRMWTTGTNFPWEDASDVALSDMMEKSLRLQDTLHNAVIGQRPAINAQALIKANQKKEAKVDQLLDFQFFEEQPGEHIVSDLADAFVNDGVITAMIPWVREVKQQHKVRTLGRIPEEQEPSDYFRLEIQRIYGDQVDIEGKGDDPNPWDFTVRFADDADRGDARDVRIDIRFFTRDDGSQRVDMVEKKRVMIYEGPRVISIDYDDVYHPPRAQNLQPPSPSNPGGAQHVIIRDFPTIDEIRRLQRNGFYDLMTKEEAEKLQVEVRNDAENEEEKIRDDMAGMTDEPKSYDKAESHNTLTRLTCFDKFDIDGDGLDEDVMWWVIKEPKLVVKAKVLQEMYPLDPKRPRPIAEASLIPVRGRRIGISMLEMLEGLHDMMKTILDQTIDSGTISIVPFWFYRPTSSMKSEIIRLNPGDGFPLTDPGRDVNMPNINNGQAQGTMINLFTMLSQMEERVSVIGDLQLGRVPAGSSSALRTVGGLSLLAGQGEARPERILRRFFMGFTQIFSIMHDLNHHFLPEKKKFRMMGTLAQNEDPYQEVTDRTEIGGRFNFTFKANVLNTSKQQLQQSLETLLGTYVNALTIQLGIATPEKVFNLLADYGRALGQDPLRYLNAPVQGQGEQQILAEEAVIMILNGVDPTGQPAEAGGWIEHLQRLLEIEQRFIDEKEDTGELSEQQAVAFERYKVLASQNAQQQQALAARAQNAEAFAQRSQGRQQGAGRPTEQPPPNPQQNPQVSGGAELLDETLPGAGGGAA